MKTLKATGQYSHLYSLGRQKLAEFKLRLVYSIPAQPGIHRNPA